jgi:hypothetical protein
MGVNLEKMSNEELVSLFAEILKILKQRGVLRTGNFLGDLGEYLAIHYYNKISGRPKLKIAPPGTKAFDAESGGGLYYSIKSARGGSTGVFHGLNDKGSKKREQKKFDYAVVVQFDNDYTVKRIFELTWKNFLKHKSWHSTMRAWYLGTGKKVIADSRIVFERSGSKHTK